MFHKIAEYLWVPSHWPPFWQPLSAMLPQLVARTTASVVGWLRWMPWPGRYWFGAQVSETPAVKPGIVIVTPYLSKNGASLVTRNGNSSVTSTRQKYLVATSVWRWM